MSARRDFYSALLGCALGVVVPGCPATIPPPVPATKLAFDVEASLEAAHCAPDGGLSALEAAHARFDRPPWIDCLFTPNGDVRSCNVPCPLP